MLYGDRCNINRKLAKIQTFFLQGFGCFSTAMNTKWSLKEISFLKFTSFILDLKICQKIQVLPSWESYGEQDNYRLCGKVLILSVEKTRVNLRHSSIPLILQKLLETV